MDQKPNATEYAAIQEMLKQFFGGNIAVVDIAEKEDVNVNLEPFYHSRAQVKRSVAFLKEIEECCGEPPVDGWSEIHQTFLRAMQNRRCSASAITVALQAGATAQSLEKLLRTQDIECWLIATDRNSREGQALHVSEELGEGVPLMTFTFSRFSTLGATLFKEPNSYTENFNKLLYAKQPACNCHPLGRKDKPQEPESGGDRRTEGV